MNWKPPDSGAVPAGWTTTVEDNSPAAVLRRYWKVIAGLAVVAALVVYGAANDDEAALSADDQGYSVHAACAQFTRDRLKAPGTADFPEYDDRGVSITSSGDTWTVRSFVDSGNGFGAKLRMEFTCVALDAGDRWRLVEWVER